MGDLGDKLKDAITSSDRSKLCESIIRFLKSLNSRYSETWFSVKEVSLSNIAGESGIPINDRVRVYEYLEENNFMWREGHAGGMRWKYSKVQDVYVTGEMIEEWINAQKSQKKSIVSSKQDKQKIGVTVRAKKQYYAVTDPVVVLHDDKIKSGFVVKSTYNYTDSEGVKHLVDYEHSQERNMSVTYEIATESSVIVVDQHNVFSSVDILLEALRVRYTLSQKK